MGSVKDSIMDDSPAGRLYIPVTTTDFGELAWRVKGTFSVGDLKEQIPDSTIPNKAEALTMTVATFFEYLANRHPDIPTCYLGLVGNDGKLATARDLFDKGETTNIFVTRLAHVPESYSDGDLTVYRQALASGELQCGVADVESIFRKGYPLGSSTFQKIFGAVGMEREYLMLATYDETVKGLDEVRRRVKEKGIAAYPELKKILADYGLGTMIPNPGFVLRAPVFDSTSKFETAGDRFISKDEERRFSGLNDEGYERWTQDIFPRSAQAQIDFTSERGILNIDGKEECVAYRRMPVLTDFACSIDENRLMLTYNYNGVDWAIPSNKEIQRGIFRKAGIYAAITEAKDRAKGDGDVNKWRGYISRILSERGIDIREVAEYSCKLMGYAVAEVANRTLGRNVFDAAPLDRWAPEFLPYASRVEMQA